MNADEQQPAQRVSPAFFAIQQGLSAFEQKLTATEVGMVNTVSTGIATVSGLPNVGFEELLVFQGGVYGIAFDLSADNIGVVLLGDPVNVSAGSEVKRTGRVMDVAVGDSLLGRVIDPLGRALDSLAVVNTGQRLPIERPATPIMARAPVSVPLQTGVKVIDALVPIGRGNAS